VANFESTALADVRRMERRAKASEMTFTPLPHLPLTRTVMFYAMLVCAIISGPSCIFMMGINKPLAIALFVAGPVFLLLAGLVSPARKAARRR
jgi:hypothetical protein